MQDALEIFLQVQKFDWIVTKSFGKDLRSGISPIRSRPRIERRTRILHWDRRDNGRPAKPVGDVKMWVQFCKKNFNRMCKECI